MEWAKPIPYPQNKVYLLDGQIRAITSHETSFLPDVVRILGIEKIT